MKMSEDALKRIGYEVVPVKFDQKIFDKARDSIMGVFANSLYHGVIRDFKIERETMLKPLRNNMFILSAGGMKRVLIDFILKNVLNKGRTQKVLDGCRVRPPHQFELFLKSRYEFVYEMSELW